MTGARLSVRSLVKHFGIGRAVDQVSFDVANGEFVSLVGPSGCGKTTLLRLIAGFELPDAGSVLSRDQSITTRPPHRRRFGVVFQSYALFPHMTVLENVCYGLKVRGVARAEATGLGRAALERVGLEQVEDRYPARLSGGQQQRVALARAIVIEPDMLLLDEPFSALDKNLREEMQVQLRRLQKRIGIATLFVTHDQEEALTLSDRLAVMRAGRILQMGPPRAVYDRPVNRFVATFLGTTNLLCGRMLSQDLVQIDEAVVAVTPGKDPPPRPDAAISLAVRPEHVRLESHGPVDTATTPSRQRLAGRVREVLFQGHRLLVLLETASGQDLRAYHPTAAWTPAPGETVLAYWNAEHASLLSDGDG